MRRLGIVLLIFILTGCSNGGSLSTEQSFVSGNGVATYFDSKERKAAPSLSGKTLQGPELVDSDGKIRILNIWASWCSPCRAEAPVLQELASAFPDVQFIGVLTRDNLVAARSFVVRFGITYPTLIDDSVIARFPGSVNPNAIPTTLVIDKNGNVAARISGEVTYSALKQLIERVDLE